MYWLMSMCFFKHGDILIGCFPECSPVGDLSGAQKGYSGKILKLSVDKNQHFILKDNTNANCRIMFKNHSYILMICKHNHVML